MVLLFIIRDNLSTGAHRQAIAPTGHIFEAGLELLQTLMRPIKRGKSFVVDQGIDAVALCRRLQGAVRHDVERDCLTAVVGYDQNPSNSPDGEPSSRPTVSDVVNLLRRSGVFSQATSGFTPFRMRQPRVLS